MNRVSLIFVTIILLLGENVKSQNLQLNEVVSQNYNGLESFEGKNEDWIEVYNNSTDTIQLQNYFLSDDEFELQKWQFPSLEIYPNSFLVIFASNENLFSPELHTNFKLSSEGEKLFLSENNIIDYISIPNLNAGLSFGRKNEQSNEWSILDIPSPKTTNAKANKLNFSHESGFYGEDFYLNIERLRPNHTIYYTLDGSEPTENSLVFNDSLFVEDRSYLPNGISEIRTSPIENIYYHNWLKPEKNTQKSTSLKLASFDENGRRTSAFYSKNYFVEINKNRFKTIALQVDSNDLFSYRNGIYVPGENLNTEELNGTGNYFLDRAVNANISIINQNNQLILDANGEIKIQGKATRASAQKSLKVYAKEKHGNKYFNAAIISENAGEQYKRFVIRNTQGAPTKSFLSDELAIEIIKDLNIDYSNYEFCEMYLNGEYWGIHSLRDKFDDHYFNIKYGYKKEQINIAEPDLSTAITGDVSELVLLRDFLENNSLNSKTDYEFVSKIIDIESYIDYLCAEMFLNNFDWPGNNSKLWKANIPGSKWRFLFYDLDDTFGAVKRNMLEHSTEINSESWRNAPKYTLLFRKLLENESFNAQFISRFQTLLETTFSSENTFKALDKILAILDPEIQKNIDRWDFPYSKNDWHTTVDKEITRFLEERPCIVAKQIKSFFELETQATKCNNKVEKNLELKISPNPNNGNFKLEIIAENISTLVDFYIIDSRGIVTQKNYLVLYKDNSIEIKNLRLPNGVYFIKVLNKGKYFGVQKFIISN